VSVHSVSNILQRLGITVQRPRLKAYEQDPQAVKQWLEETWPAIQREAKAAKAVMYFGDESSIRSDYHRGTTWGIRGQTPVVQKTGRRFSVNLISALSPRGELRFMVTEQRLTTAVFIDFLKRLRDVRPFATAEALVEQMRLDEEGARAYFAGRRNGSVT
jgi:hypothetical protein